MTTQGKPHAIMRGGEPTRTKITTKCPGKKRAERAVAPDRYMGTGWTMNQVKQRDHQQKVKGKVAKVQVPFTQPQETQKL